MSNKNISGGYDAHLSERRAGTRAAQPPITACTEESTWVFESGISMFTSHWTAKRQTYMAGNMIEVKELMRMRSNTMFPGDR